MPRNPGGTVSGFKLLSTPDAPTITGVTTSIGSASVAFTAPSDTGDGAISSYVVTAVDESSGASTGGTGTSSPITVSPPAGGTFKIRMQALNPYGPGRLTEYDTGNAIYSGASLWAWGQGGSGQQGRNNTTSTDSPNMVGALTTWLSLGIGSSASHSFAIKTDGTLWGWGYNGQGQIGNGARLNLSSPIQIGALTDWSQAAIANKHSLLLRNDGSLFSCGDNTDGQLGQNNRINRSSPVQIGSAVWAKVAAGRSTSGGHSLAITTSGSLYAWGDGLQGQLGNGSTTRSSPVQVGALTNWSSIAAGNSRSMAIKTDNTLWGWGSSDFGSLGINATGNWNSPIQIGSLTNWKNVSSGTDSSIAVKTDGTLWAFGRNDRGQLGQNNNTDRSSPVQVGSLSTWNTVSCGSITNFSIKNDKTLWGWGYNASGAVGYVGFIGDGTKINRSSPVQVGALTNWVAISGKEGFSHALYGVV